MATIDEIRAQMFGGYSAGPGATSGSGGSGHYVGSGTPGDPLRYVTSDGQELTAAQARDQGYTQTESYDLNAKRAEQLANEGIEQNSLGQYVIYDNQGNKTGTTNPNLAYLQYQASQGNLGRGNEMPLTMQTLRDYAPGGIPPYQPGPAGSVGTQLGNTPPNEPYLPDDGNQPPPGDGKGGKGGQQPPTPPPGGGKGGQQPPPSGGKGGQPPPQQGGKGGGYNPYAPYGPNYGGPYGGNNGAGKGGPDQPYQPAPSGSWMQGGYQGNYTQPYPSYNQNPYGSYDSGGGKGGNQPPPGGGKGGYAAGGKFVDDPYHSNLKPNKGQVQRDVKKRERLGFADGGSTSMGKGGSQPSYGGKGGGYSTDASNARVDTSMIPPGGTVPSDTGGPSEIMGKGGRSYPAPTQSGKGGGGFGGGGGYSTRPQNPYYSSMPPSGGFGGGYATRPQNPYYNPPQQPGYGKGGVDGTGRTPEWNPNAPWRQQKAPGLNDQAMGNAMIMGPNGWQHYGAGSDMLSPSRGGGYAQPGMPGYMSQEDARQRMQKLLQPDVMPPGWSEPGGSGFAAINRQLPEWAQRGTKIQQDEWDNMSPELRSLYEAGGTQRPEWAQPFYTDAMARDNRMELSPDSAGFNDYRQALRRYQNTRNNQPRR